MVVHRIKVRRGAAGRKTINDQAPSSTRPFAAERTPWLAVSYEKRLPGVRRRPDNPQTWSAAGELQPGKPCNYQSKHRTVAGQTPSAAASIRSARPERTEPTPLLNHETSDHLLSLVDCQVANRHRSHPECAHGRSTLQADLLRVYRQSSTTRPISAQTGNASGGVPSCSSANLPRLNAIASSSGSVAVSMAAA